MEDLFYEKLKDNEEKVRKLGPHLMGAVNAICNLAIYPLFQSSIQLQISKTSQPNYTGKHLKSKLLSLIYTPNPSNRAFLPPTYKNYPAVFLHNSLQGPLGYYKGYFYSISFFYLSVLSRNFISFSGLADSLGLTLYKESISGTT
jgi:hypothetical protein